MVCIVFKSNHKSQNPFHFCYIRFVYCTLGAFKIFDISKANAVTRSDMRKVLRASYELLGKSLTDESDSPATRTDRVFSILDAVSNQQLVTIVVSRVKCVFVLTLWLSSSKLYIVSNNQFLVTIYLLLQKQCYKQLFAFHTDA